MEKYIILHKLNLIAAVCVLRRAFRTGWARWECQFLAVIPAVGGFAAQFIHFGSAMPAAGRITTL